MENPENVGVTGGRRLLKSQNIDSRLLVDKIPGMCELRVTLRLARSRELKKDQVRLEFFPALPFGQLRAGCSSILVPSSIIRGRVKGFAAISSVSDCSRRR
jgi:hypothetical protein